jgi:hypothetical protein
VGQALSPANSGGGDGFGEIGFVLYFALLARNHRKKTGIRWLSPASKAPKESCSVTRILPALPTDGGMSKIPTKESKLS